jgi:uncharacterized Zn finger protein (UPF0148 family)
MFDKQDLINWCCPYCGAALTRPVSYFLTGPWFCPMCNMALNFMRVHEVLDAYEKDSGKKLD